MVHHCYLAQPPTASKRHNIGPAPIHPLLRMLPLHTHLPYTSHRLAAPPPGKSTFARALLARAPAAWAHINQDSIANGKPGNRKQCLRAAKAALSSGKSCVIDR